MTIKEFLVELSRTPRQWCLIAGAIRQQKPLNCPISAVAKQRGFTDIDVAKECNEKDCSNWIFVDARSSGRRLLKLSEKDAKSLVHAADNSAQQDKQLRTKLLKACGL